MNKLRNPFKIRASEKIDSDINFLKLFSHIVLDSILEKHKQEKLWGNVLYIRSSPGAGKTSLLRVFEPNCLKILVNNRSSNNYKELYSILKSLDVLNNDSIKLLSSSIQCSRNFEILEELDIDDVKKRRFFFSLLNARIILSVLSNASSFLNLRFPEDLSLIKLSYSEINGIETGFYKYNNGKELFDWASEIEKKIFKKIDSFLPIEDDFIEGHNELFALELLTPTSLIYDERPICEKVLFILDDAHKLSFSQRKNLKKFLNEKRGSFSIWVSERLEALEYSENIGSFPERDYDEINIEGFWRNYPSKFDRVLKSISQKRAEISTEDVSAFEEHLSNDLNENRYVNEIYNYINTNLSKLKELTSFTTKYDDWILSIENFEGTPYNKALYLSKVSIIINRYLNKSQLSFDFYSLSKEELEDKIKDITSPAELFLAKNAELPYYYGFSMISKASSFNIEQFLSFSSLLYEEMISKKIMGESINVNEFEQHNALKKISEKKWNDIKNIVPFPDEIISFLKKLTFYCFEQTYKPNAPYGTGVNGFAIRTKIQSQLFDNDVNWIDDIVYQPFLRVLSLCISYNLLEPQQVNQGLKGEVVQVYYLNRWICIHYNLPLSYGGWRHKNIDELTKWIL